MDSFLFAPAAGRHRGDSLGRGRDTTGSAERLVGPLKNPRRNTKQPENTGKLAKNPEDQTAEETAKTGAATRQTFVLLGRKSRSEELPGFG